MQEKIKRIKELTNKLNKYRNSYYNEDFSLISDYDYDILFDELKNLEESTGFYLSNSPTKTVGYEIKSNLKKVKHPIPLLSLEKTKSISDLNKFAERGDCIIMPKYDGLTVELYYKNGELVRASTRGDGFVGEDITHNAKTFKNIPLEIPYKGKLRLAGEAIIHKNDFEKINKESEKKYANPRNLASGSVRQLNSKICEKRDIHWMLWDVLEGFDDIPTRSGKFFECSLNGFPEADFYYITINEKGQIEEKAIKEHIDTVKEFTSFKEIPIDGCVVKYNNIEFSNSLGGTSHHNNDGIAYKFDDNEEETTLRKVEWQIGRTGKLTPVAIFDPIDLEGTIVTKATLHNLSNIEELNLYLEDKICVYKANEIIPQVKEVLAHGNKTPLNKVSPPMFCPICGKKTRVESSETSKSLYCDNDNCIGKTIWKYVHFVGKNGMDIKGFSEATIEKFITKKLIKDFSDIYKLDKFRHQISNMDGFGSKSFKKLWKGIEESRKTELWRVISAFSIPLVGKTTSKKIAEYCDNDVSVFLQKASSNYDWTSIDDFGVAVSQSINDFFHNVKNLNSFENVLAYVDIKYPNNYKSIDKENKFYNKTIVITGSFGDIKRDYIQKCFEEMGAKVTNSVSKRTDYLIVGENSGSKLEKAKKLNIEIISDLKGVI